MHRELTPYLAEFAGADWEKPPRFASSLPGVSLPSAPAASSGAVRPAGPTPPLAPGVRPWVFTVEGWRQEMREAASEVAQLRLEIARRKSGTVERSAEADTFRATGVHPQPDYRTREYPVPTNGTCDLGQLVWADLWARAQTIFRKLAATPPVGTPGEDVFRWVGNIRTLHGLLFDTPNLRSRFFYTAGTWLSDPRAGLVYDKGLASDAQARGIYTAPSRPAGVTVLTAMDYAPLPSGGYAELLGSNLRQRMHLSYETSVARDRGGRIVAGTIVEPEQYRAGVLDGATQLGTAGAYVPNPFSEQAWVAGEVAWLWTKSESESPLRGTQRAYAPSGVDPRRWRVYNIKTDIAAWIRNAFEFAAYFGDPRLVLGEVLLRTTGFYLNSYLDYGARNGLVPRSDLDAGRAEGERLRAQATNELRIATYTATGIVSAVVSAIPVVGAILAGLLSAATALLVELGGAASGGIFVSPVLPLYDRVFAGSCRESMWISRREPGEPGTGPEAPPPPGPPPVDTSSVKGPAGIVLGLGALWFAFRLLSSGKSR